MSSTLIVIPAPPVPGVFILLSKRAPFVWTGDVHTQLLPALPKFTGEEIALRKKKEVALINSFMPSSQCSLFVTANLLQNELPPV